MAQNDDNSDQDKPDEDADDNDQTTPSPSSSPISPPQRHKLTCGDCNRAFCMDYNLPICKGAKEEDVFTTCFQRDSLKDELVVILFMLATTSLLGWALIKPWVQRFRDASLTRKGTGGTTQSYIPVSMPRFGNASTDANGNGSLSRNSRLDTSVSNSRRAARGVQ